MSERHTITVISWNVSEKHADLDAITEIRHADYGDSKLVLCLQEVPEHLLEALDQLADDTGMDMIEGLDKTRLQKDGKTRDCYLVIMSELEIVDSSEWQISDTSRRSWITNMFIGILRKAGKWDDTAIASGALGVDLQVGHKEVRVITTHLSLTDPQTRKKEFDSILAHRLFTPTIICGDFNILQGKFGRTVNLLIGNSIPYAFWRSERKEFNELLITEGLVNPISGIRTHKAGQLDHIAYGGRGITHIGWKVFPKGASDHTPVSATFQV